jgi:peroxiredoxin
MNIPQVDFYVFNEDGEIVTKTTKDLFMGKRSVVVTLPGAFTPTCSTQQVPGFNAIVDTLKADHNVDQVVVLSVNDAYVMRAWQKSLGDQADKLVFVPDGNGAFTEGMQALVSKGNKGMGMRSWRCVLIINENCVIEHGLVEAGLRGNASDDPYEETTPERCIGQLIMLDANNAAAEQADANIAHTFQELAAKA